MLVRQDNKKEQEEISNMSEAIKTSNDIYIPSQATISNSTVNKETVKQDYEVIEQFIEYCNQKEVEKAYDLLSSDCKEIVYQNVQAFYDNYYSDIFTEKKSYELDTWMSSTNITYKVKILNNFMSSGKIDEEYFEDYITVVKENDTKKLNIRNFIEKRNLNVEKEIPNTLKVSIVSKQRHMDYEQYEIKIENFTNQEIILDTKEKTDTTYIEDSNGGKYIWYGHEVIDEDLKIQAGEVKTINIKFSKVYNLSRENEKMVFSNILANNEKTKVDINIYKK